MKTADVRDRYHAWRNDPATPAEPDTAAAFVEGFAQALEFVSGNLRSPESLTSSQVTADWEE